MLGGLAAESEVGVVQRLLLQAQTALASYAEPGWAVERGLAAVRRRAAGSSSDTADPGSDHQLAIVNALAGRCCTAEALDAHGRLALGRAVPLEGLTVDTDLRWRLLHALVAHGAAGEAEIDAEYARDNTATGRAAGRAGPRADPDPRGQGRGLAAGGARTTTLPNAINEAIIVGFSHPAPARAARAYVPRYFAEVDEVWARRTSEQAQPMVQGLFPSWAVEQPTVDAADAWLADDSTRRPCAGSSPRAARASCAPSPPGSSTAAEAARARKASPEPCFPRTGR